MKFSNTRYLDTPSQMSEWLVFSGLLIVRLLCAQYSIISDCDEVFNYWEPLHFLTHGFGLQTWEYSPEYAIRSWFYISLHAIVVGITQSMGLNKSQLFYVLRIAFAILSASVETRLYKSIRVNISSRVAVWYVLISATATGLFHASISFLPSSFAMHLFTLALSYFLNFSADDVVKGIDWTIISGIVGWPFSLALVLPFGLQFTGSCLAKQKFKTFGIAVYKVLRCILAMLVVLIGFDSLAYRRFSIVPLNIVLYNVINQTEDSGPNIFGTEPWTYYFLNLALNFNLTFAAALASIFIPILQALGLVRFMNCSKNLAFAISPFFLWLGIFIAQPHKEERFIYVTYASLCFNAAVTIDAVTQIWQKIGSTTGSLFRAIHWSIVALTILTPTILISLSRSIALATYYRAPIDVFNQLPTNATGNVCIGREWYRYPSSYFLNDNTRLKFIKSGFNGLLPGEYIEHDFSKSWWFDREGIWSIPQGMNNQNLEDMSKYVAIDQCDYVVDIDSEVNTEAGEVLFTQSEKDWDRLYCTKFLDSAQSKGIGRVFWLPETVHRLTNTNLVWNDYCILKHI